MLYKAVRNAGWRVDPAAVSTALKTVFRRSNVSHGPLLYEMSGVQYKLNAPSACFPPDIVSMSGQLIEKSKHPGIILAKNRNTPFCIFEYKAELAIDSQVSDFFEIVCRANFLSFYFLPIRDLTGNLFVSAIATGDRSLSAIEVRLIHSFCLDAVAKLTATTADPLVKNLLTLRERECLTAAAKGYTEKVTARVLAISPNTVHSHLENCKRKLGARNKLSAIIKGLSLGEIMPEGFASDHDDPLPASGVTLQ